MSGWVLTLVTLILFALFIAGYIIVNLKVQHRIVKPIGICLFGFGLFIIYYPIIRQVAITCYQWIRSIL